MRISTPMMFDEGIRNIQDRQSQMNRLQTQLASGQQLLSPSDDPAASAKILGLQQSQLINQQYSKNSQNATNTLDLMDASIQNVVDTLQSLKTSAIQGGNAALSSQDRETIAQQIDQAFQQIIGTANTTDANGEYIFSGYSANVKPFVESSTGRVNYMGDQGQRNSQVSALTQIPVSQSGFSVFEKIPAGNGVFVTSTGATNTGGGAVEAGSITNPSQLTGHSYSVSFNVTTTNGQSSTSYTVTDSTSNQAVLTNQSYLPGSAIQFDGLQFAIQGNPAQGDTFDVKPATNQSIFTTLDQMRQALRAPQMSASDKASFQTNFGQALAGLDQSLDHIVNTQASIGNYGQQAEASKNQADDLDVQYKKQLAQLQDLDYTKAISDFTQQQTYLEAAQKTFVQIQGLSLFNFID